MKKVEFILMGTIILSIILFFLWMREKSNSESQMRNAREWEAKAITYRDEAGRSHAKAVVLNQEMNRMKAYYPKQLESLANDFEVKIKNLRSGLQLIKETSQQIEVVYDTMQVPRDTLLYQWGQNYMQYEDKWLTLEAATLGRVWRINYTVRDSISVASYYERKGLFKRQLMVEAVSHNPKTTLTNVSTFQIKEKPRRWAVGPFIGVTLVEDKFRPVVGIGFNYSLFSF